MKKFIIYVILILILMSLIMGLFPYNKSSYLSAYEWIYLGRTLYALLISFFGIVFGLTILFILAWAGSKVK